MKRIQKHRRWRLFVTLAFLPDMRSLSVPCMPRQWRASVGLRGLGAQPARSSYSLPDVADSRHVREQGAIFGFGDHGAFERNVRAWTFLRAFPKLIKKLS
jgi:hypothetical protein